MAPLRCAFLLLEPAPAWTVTRAIDDGLRLQSPRTPGFVRFSAVRVPKGLGVQETEELWKRTRTSQWIPPGRRRFDTSEWVNGEVHGIAFSTLWNADDEEHLADLPARLPSRHPEFQRSILRRDWCLTRGVLVVDAMYLGPDEPRILAGVDGGEVDRSNRDLFEDLLDCEEMVRSSCFDPRL